MKNRLSILLILCISSTFSLLAEDDYLVGQAGPGALIPLNAVYLGDAKNNRTKVEVMVRTLPLLPEELKNVPLTKRDLTNIPQTKLGDKVYELSASFPNCDPGNKDLWVVYNATSSYVIASVDPLLRTSVNEYVDNVVMKQRLKVRLSVTYLKVKGSVPIEMEALQRSDHRVVMRATCESRSGEEFELGHAGSKVRCEVWMGEDRRGADASLNITGYESKDISTSFVIEMGQQIIKDLGVTEGNERGVIILKLDYLDELGRVLGYHQTLASRLDGDDDSYQGYDYWRHHFRSYPIQLSELFFKDKVQLVVPPEEPIYRRNDVVYDLTANMALQGIKMRGGGRLLYNQTVGQLDFMGTEESLENLWQLFSGLGQRVRRNISLTSSFYEVDAKLHTGRKWSLEEVLASHPVLLGNLGGIIRSGEMCSIHSKYGVVKWSALFGGVIEGRGDKNEWIESLFEMGLELSGREIKWSKEDFLCVEKPVFIEVRRDGEKKKSIVMRVSIEVDSVGYHKKLQNGW